MVWSRKPKRFLTAEQKYDLWVRMLTGQVTQGAAAAEAGVDRTVISKIRSVARDGAIAALQASRPGRPTHSKLEAAEIAALAAEIAALAAEVARLERTIVEQAVELAVSFASVDPRTTVKSLPATLRSQPSGDRRPVAHLLGYRTA